MKCPKSADPYNYCPWLMRVEDEMILKYLDLLVQDIRRLNNLPMEYGGDEAREVDRTCATITAYMNGRLREVKNSCPDGNASS